MMVFDKDHGRLVVRRSLTQLVLWHKQQRARETMSVNKDLKSNNGKIQSGGIALSCNSL